MTAEVLRRAASLMRERAEKAEQGRWKLWGMTVMADPKGTSDVDDCIPVADPYTPSWCERAPRTWNASHIASWDPAVALAVADWLDAEASNADAGIRGQGWNSIGGQSDALTVARTYLGEQPC